MEIHAEYTTDFENVAALLVTYELKYSLTLNRSNDISLINTINTRNLKTPELMHDDFLVTLNSYESWKSSGRSAYSSNDKATPARSTRVRAVGVRYPGKRVIKNKCFKTKTKITRPSPGPCTGNKKGTWWV